MSSLTAKTLVSYTRFSITDDNLAGAWHLSTQEKLNRENYLIKLFDPQRIEPRLYIMENYLLPSLELLAKKFIFRHVIFYSDLLPDIYKKELSRLASQYEFVILSSKYSNPLNNNEVLSFFKTKLSQLKIVIPAARMRIDDDDMLSTAYAQSIDEFVELKLSGMCVSLSRGVQALFDYQSKTYFSPRIVNIPSASQGLVEVGTFNPIEQVFEGIPESGSHHSVSDRHPLILSSARISYLYTSHASQDSVLNGGLESIVKRLRDNKNIPTNKDLNRLFPWCTFSNDLDEG